MSHTGSKSAAHNPSTPIDLYKSLSDYSPRDLYIINTAYYYYEYSLHVHVIVGSYCVTVTVLCVYMCGPK